MLKKKKNILFVSSLAGLVIGTTSISVALSACTTTDTTDNSDLQYSYSIDWDNEEQVKRLNIDESGLVYSDKTKTTLIAVSPKAILSTVTIPSTVKNISGYVKVTTNNKGIKVYQSVGAFQNMVSLGSVTIQSGSELKSIGGSAFSGCSSLKTISGLSNSLEYVGTNAFANCTNLDSIDTSNVVRIDDGAFSGCASLTSINLSKAIHIGNNAFRNCSNLTSLGSTLEHVKTIGEFAFSRATKSGSNIELKLSNLQTVSKSAFEAAKGINKVDFSNNTLLTTLVDNAFLYSSITEADFSGCSNLTFIGERVFEGCTNLTNVDLPSNDITNLSKLGWNAFLGCTNIKTIGPKGTKTGGFVATKKLTTIGANCFANSSVNSIDLSNFKPASTNLPFGSVTSLAFIPNLSSIILPEGITTLNACLFYGSGIGENGGFSLTLPSSITNIISTENQIITNPNNSSSNQSISNATPFTNSGVTSVDMSKVTSYQSTSGSESKIPSYLFLNANKLESVVLKNNTSEIGTSAFQGTSSLLSITYPPTSDVETTAEAANGFTALPSLNTIGKDAFNGAFSETSNAKVDLNSMRFTETPAAFNHSKITSLILPNTVQKIIHNSFDNTTKLSSVNFEDLTNLNTICVSNFTNTQLKSIDLSKTNFSSIDASTPDGGSTKLFTNLPNDCVVSLPNVIDNFSGVFLNKNNDPITFNYPNGLKITSGTNFANVSGGVLTFSTTNTQQLGNVGSMDLSVNNDTIYSIGQNTFFGNNKLKSITLRAKDITTNGVNTPLFSATSGITPNTNTKNDVSNSSYIKSKVPFGNNDALTTLNYANFTKQATSVAAEGDAQKALFNTTNATTWNEVAKIINSLSYQANATSSNVTTLKANMSSWSDPDDANNTSSAVINKDAVLTLDGSKTKVSLTNSFDIQSVINTAAGNQIEIRSDITSKKFIHNGITWTYTNDGSTIKLSGKANMYKATYKNSNANTNYLAFFNQTEYVKTGTPNEIHYVPSSTPVNVTLTIATKTTTQTK